MANYNHNLIKVNRNYTFQELAGVLGVHKNTVASWVKNGLPCLKDCRPFLIIGPDARKFLKAKRRGKKQKCKPNELYCLRCKLPTTLAANIVEYVPKSPSKGRLTGFCIRCGCVVNKYISYGSLDRCMTIFDLTKPKGLEHINDSDNPLSNSAFKKGDKS